MSFNTARITVGRKHIRIRDPFPLLCRKWTKQRIYNCYNGYSYKLSHCLTSFISQHWTVALKNVNNLINSLIHELGKGVRSGWITHFQTCDDMHIVLQVYCIQVYPIESLVVNKHYWDKVAPENAALFVNLRPIAVHFVAYQSGSHDFDEIPEMFRCGLFFSE